VDEDAGAAVRVLCQELNEPFRITVARIPRKLRLKGRELASSLQYEVYLNPGDGAPVVEPTGREEKIGKSLKMD